MTKVKGGKKIIAQVNLSHSFKESNGIDVWKLTLIVKAIYPVD